MPHSLFSHLLPSSSPLPCYSSESSADLSGSDIEQTPALRDLSLPPVLLHPPYHYSNLRTTTNKPNFAAHEKEFIHPGLSCCCDMDPIVIDSPPSTCDECVQECEEDCELELTEQCTDQCVVVPCHDPHYGLPPCDEANGDISCEVPSVNNTSCSTLDNFIACCGDYRQFFADIRPSNEASGHLPWPALSENMFQGYAGLPTSSPSGFYTHNSSEGTSQLVPSPSSFITSPQPLPNMVSSTAAHPFSMAHHEARPPAAGHSCMWSNCTATFSSMNELVGHVNLEHLRLPAAPESSSPMNIAHIDTRQQQQQQLDAANPLSCLWADCQVYPTPDSIPGPSSGNQTDNLIGVLANHLLQDHLGLPLRPSSTDLRRVSQEALVFPRPHHIHQQHHVHQQSSHSHQHSFQATQHVDHTMSTMSPEHEYTSESPAASGPLTPAPEHDCSEPHAHVCHWKDCGQSFASCDALTAHITSTHVGGGKAHYDCYWDGCLRHGDNGFASKQKICRHLQSHTGHRPFQCKICQQNFSEAATLAQHMRRHTQEKPYVCDFPGCGKSFAITGALTIHKRTHNGDKPFKCTYCDRAFSESSNLSKHLRTHTGARPYPCTEPGCNKSFARPDQLTRHMAIHRKNENKLAEALVPIAA